MIIVIPMAGPDDNFRKHGFQFAKPLIEIDGRPLVEHAFECLQVIDDTQFAFVVRKDDDLRYHLGEVLKLMNPGAAVIRADGDTAGAACTVLLAIEHLKDDEELLVANADQVLSFDLSEAIADFRARELDGGTIVFDSVHPRWSFVKTDADGRVIEAAEKRPISRNATAGIYYFRRSADFVAAAQSMIRKGASVNGGYYVCPAFNEMILAQKKVGVFRIDREQYTSLATPQAVEDYEQAIVAQKRGTAV